MTLVDRTVETNDFVVTNAERIYDNRYRYTVRKIRRLYFVSNYSLQITLPKRYVLSIRRLRLNKRKKKSNKLSTRLKPLRETTNCRRRYFSAKIVFISFGSNLYTYVLNSVRLI